jgi:hypothetical protein
MKIDYHRYSNEEYQSLIDDINASYHQGDTIPYLIKYIQGIINGEDEDKIWISHQCKNYLYKQDLINIPRFLNNPNKIIRIIVKWRLKIGK